MPDKKLDHADIVLVKINTLGITKYNYYVPVGVRILSNRLNYRITDNLFIHDDDVINLILSNDIIKA